MENIFEDDLSKKINEKFDKLMALMDEMLREAREFNAWCEERRKQKINESI